MNGAVNALMNKYTETETDAKMAEVSELIYMAGTDRDWYVPARWCTHTPRPLLSLSGSAERAYTTWISA